MENKIISIDDIINRPIDEITKLYIDGYRLEENNKKYASLQICPDTTISLLFGLVIGAVAGTYIGYTMRKK